LNIILRSILRISLSILTALMFLNISGCGSGMTKGADEVNFLNSDTGKAVISLTEYEHDFGKVETGEKIGYIFTFLNTGKGNLVINSVSTSCGCTVPKYDKKPLASGEKGSLEVIFNTAGYDGIQTKTITVQSNATTPVVILKITAEVINSN